MNGPIIPQRRPPRRPSRGPARNPSRRAFLTAIGAVAGAAGVYETMVALGVIKTPPAWTDPFKLAAGSGNGKSVVILGAGMAGLAAAYELQKAGYACTVLELLDRPGGRNFTARRGTKVVEDTGPNGRTEQTCAFDDGLYMNLGPARLPYHHPRCMHYCRELAIPLEVYVMSTTANLFQSDLAFGGKPQTRAQIGSDSEGYVAELLAKAIKGSALDAELSAADRATFLEMLNTYGGLHREGHVTGVETPRGGCLTPMTVEALCNGNLPLPLDELLKSSFWAKRFYQPVEGEWQPTLFQPVGGMDRLVDGFVRHVGRSIRYNAEIQQIAIGDDGVSVSYRDRRGGSLQTVTADYCFSNMPLPKLAKLNVNFAEDFKQAVDHAHTGALYKLAWQANRRFWEEPPYNIFGGISYTDRPITQLWYPSNDYMSAKGIIPGSYTYSRQAEIFGQMTLAQRIDAGRADAIKLHKEFADKTLVPDDKAVSIAWNQAEGQSGGFTAWDVTRADDRQAYQRLLSPDRRFHVIGDQVSPLAGWQEGAFLSSEHAILQIIGQRPA